MKKISAIIVAYNTKVILIDCLQNLGDCYPNMEIIVVDNGDDGSAEAVEIQFPHVKVLRSGGNVGLAKGSNIGLQAATGDYLLYLGSDAFPKKDVLAGLVNYFEQNQDVGIATAKLVLRTGKPDMDAHRGFPTPWAALTHFAGLDRFFPKSKVFNSYFQGYKDFSKSHEIDMCISHFMMIRREVFDQIGRWEERFFLFGEDVDFCYRAKQAGWKVMYLPQWEVTHYKGVGIGIRKESSDISTASPETKKRSRKNSVDAMKFFYELHYKTKYPRFVTALVFLGIDALTFLRTKSNL